MTGGIQVWQENALLERKAAETADRGKNTERLTLDLFINRRVSSISLSDCPEDRSVCVCMSLFLSYIHTLTHRLHH